MIAISHVPCMYIYYHQRNSCQSNSTIMAEGLNDKMEEPDDYMIDYYPYRKGEQNDYDSNTIRFIVYVIEKDNLSLKGE